MGAAFGERLQRSIIGSSKGIADVSGDDVPLGFKSSCFSEPIEVATEGTGVDTVSLSTKLSKPSATPSVDVSFGLFLTLSDF
jgi:hypothetical protein